jgi:hypothetical protein
VYLGDETIAERAPVRGNLDPTAHAEIIVTPGLAVPGEAHYG